MKILDILKYEKLNINKIKISDLASVESRAFIEKRPGDLRFSDIFPGCVLYLRGFKQPFIIIDAKSYSAIVDHSLDSKNFNTTCLFSATVTYSRKLKYVGGIPQKEKHITSYNFDNSYIGTWPNDDDETDAYDVVKVYIPENAKDSFATKKEFFKYFDFVEESTNKTLLEKLNINPINVQDLSNIEKIETYILWMDELADMEYVAQITHTKNYIVALSTDATRTIKINILSSEEFEQYKEYITECSYDMFVSTLNKENTKSYLSKMTLSYLISLKTIEEFDDNIKYIGRSSDIK